MIKFVKIVIIKICYKLYLIFNLNFLITIIKYVGGPLFIKIFQNFNNLNNIVTNDTMSGSIGKIYKNDNIIKKTLHLDIKNKLKESIELLRLIIDDNNIPFPFYFNEYIQINMNQVDLNLERDYSLRLSKIFSNVKNVKIINIISSSYNYHYSEFIDGYTINYFLNSHKDKYDVYRIEILRLLYLSYYLMLSNNLFHCDWHFGNFLVNIDNNDNIILYILDTGLMGELIDNNHYNKLKILLSTNLLYPEPINIIKFLSFINLNSSGNINNFISISKKIINDDISYRNKIIKILENASYNNLKFPIVILYMIQTIIFMDNLLDKTNSLTNNGIYKDFLEISKKYGFYKEIQKTIL
jgi:hypothetical protein